MVFVVAVISDASSPHRKNAHLQNIISYTDSLLKASHCSDTIRFSLKAVMAWKLV